MDAARQAMEILGKCLNKVDGKFKALEEFTLEENVNSRRSWRGVMLQSIR